MREKERERCVELTSPVSSSSSHLNPNCLQLSTSSVYILPLPSLRTAFHTRVLLLRYSIFSGSKLSRSISGDVPQHRHSFWVYREI